jgi:uncharacterized low-complexity protein
MKKTAMKNSTILGAALLATYGLSQSANAEPAGALFSAVDLNHGYMVSLGEGKCGEGKCGGDQDKEDEGKCGEGKCGADGDDKDGEGKCGEGKCGDVA